MAVTNFAGQGWVARALSAARNFIDNQLADATGPRMGRYQEQYILAPMVGEPVIADEGGLMIASMTPSQTGLFLGVSATYSATAAAAIVFKNNAATGGVRCTLRAIHFLCAQAPASGTSLLYATVVDNVNRTPSSINGSVGTPGTPTTLYAYQALSVNANIDYPSQPVGQVWFPNSVTGGGPPTIPAAGAGQRVLVGNGSLRSVIPVGAATSGVQDDYRIVFGATDVGQGGFIGSTAGSSRIVEPHPSVVLGPQEYFILFIWAPSNSANGFEFAGLDVSWYER